MRRRLFIFLRIAVGAALLAWVLQRTEFSAATRIPFHNLDDRWLMVAFGFGGLSVIGWALRWFLFLRIYGLAVRFGEVLRLTLFADFFNLFFLGPLGGDGVRLLLLARKFPDRKAAITGAIILDHATGLLGGTLLYFVFTRTHTAWLTAEGSVLRHTALISADLFLGGMTVFTLSGLAVAVEPSLQRFIREKFKHEWMFKPLMPFAFLREHRPALLLNFLLSVFTSMFSYLAYWAAGKSFASDFPVDKLLAIMPAVDMVAALPVTVSGLGVRENLFVELLGSRLAIGPSGALIVSLLGFAANGLWGLIGGVWLALHRWRSVAPVVESQTSIPAEMQRP